MLFVLITNTAKAAIMTNKKYVRNQESFMNMIHFQTNEQFSKKIKSQTKHSTLGFMFIKLI